MSTTNIIKQIRNVMREDSGLDGDAQRIPQLVWLIFLKVYDDKERQNELLLGNKYSPIIASDYQWRSWAGNVMLTGDELLEFVNTKLFPYLKSIEIVDENSPALIVTQVFEDAINYSKSGTLLRQVINIINSSFDFNKSHDRHVLNDFYEQMLKSLSDSQSTGQFYTPKALTEFIVEMVDPKPDEKICDPACGTGGFLVSSIEHIKKRNLSSEQLSKLNENIIGTELKQMPHLLCMTNMILHGIDSPKRIVRGSSLNKPITSIDFKDKVDAIVANPPFGGVVKQGEEQNFPPQFRSKETADLFMVLMINLLKHEGRAGVVLPDGILFGEGSQSRLKQELLETCDLHTIVKIPSGAFIYTPISTNLLFFTKGKPTKDVWYYEIKPPEGKKSFGKTKLLTASYFEECKKWWNNRVASDVAWKVSIDDIKAKNYNLDFKNPYIGEVEKELSYDELTAKIIENSQKIINILTN
jgi:type I restriction enzyme M protein